METPNMSNKIDFREMTRNFLTGDGPDDAPAGNHGLLKEGEDRRLLIVREASRLRHMFNSSEIDFLIDEIKRL